MNNLLNDKQFTALVLGLATFLGGKLWSWLDGKTVDRLSSFAERLGPLFNLVLQTQPGLTLEKLHDLLAKNATALATSLGLPSNKALNDAISSEITKALDAFISNHASPEAVAPQIPGLVARLTPPPPAPKKQESGRIGMFFLLMFSILLIAIAASCKSGGGVPKPVAAGIECAEQNIWKVVEGEKLRLYQLVVKVFSTGADGYLGELEGLAVKAGDQALACATYTYELSFGLPTAQGSGMRTDFLVLDRVAAYVSAKGYQFAQ